MKKSEFYLDNFVGLECFMTDSRGIGGRMRKSVEDFFVEEVVKEAGKDENGKYVRFMLEKRNWETIKAIDEIARQLGVSRKRFEFAGTKDKRAITRQQVSAFNVELAKLQNLRIKDIELSDFKLSSAPVKLGDLEGNRFGITVREIENAPGAAEAIEACRSELEEKGIPNYFGYQRFGVIRPNTHLVGKSIVEGNIEGAVMDYIAKVFEGEDEESKEAREFAASTRDFKKALEIFPKKLRYERALLSHLASYPRDFVGALRRLNKHLRLMFVHAYQSYLFNKVLSRAIEREIALKDTEINIFGYDTVLSENKDLREIEEAVLEEENVKLENFKIKSAPALSSRGIKRKALLFEKVDYELNLAESACKFKFYLPKASYATCVMREFMKAEPINY